MYNVDQWKIFKILGSALPKRECFTIGAIKDKSFRQAPNDRVVRNAIRKPVSEEHVEIADRGEYRLTAKGSSFFQKMEKEGFKPGPVRAMAKPLQSPTKKTEKKAAKPVKKAAPKKVAKPAAKKVVKAAPKKAPEPKAAKSNGNGDKPAPKKNAVKIPRPKDAPKDEAAETKAPPAQLTF